MHEPDTLVEFGSAAKALDNSGRVGGHLVRWGDAENTDISSYRDFFAKDTDHWAEFPAKVPVIYHHGQDGRLGLTRLGTAEIKADEAGLWIEGQLNLRDDYERKVWEMVKAGKLGLSSGSAPHLVRREKQSNGSHKITSWPIVEASLTPTPAEPRILVHALKSLIGDDADTTPSLISTLESLATDAERACVLTESAIKSRAREGRSLPVEKVAALKALADAFGRLLHEATAPDRAAEARKRLLRARLEWAASGAKES